MHACVFQPSRAGRQCSRCNQEGGTLKKLVSQAKEGLGGLGHTSTASLFPHRTSLLSSPVCLNSSLQKLEIITSTMI